MLQSTSSGDAISGENAKTIESYDVLNFEAATLSSFRENQNQPFAYRVDDGRPTRAPFSGSSNKSV